MATNHDSHHHSHGDDGATPLNHETTDISLDGIGKLTIGFVVFLVVVSASMYGTYRMLDRRARAADTSISRINADRRAVGVPGSGLGMSIVKEIMDIHGGRIEIASKPLQGTSVTLWLPRAAPRG